MKCCSDKNGFLKNYSISFVSFVFFSYFCSWVRDSSWVWVLKTNPVTIIMTSSSKLHHYLGLKSSSSSNAFDDALQWNWQSDETDADLLWNQILYVTCSTPPTTHFEYMFCVDFEALIDWHIAPCNTSKIKENFSVFIHQTLFINPSHHEIIHFY